MRKKSIRGIPVITPSASWKAAADGSLEQILEQKSRQARCCNSDAELIRSDSHFVMLTDYVQESNKDDFLRNMDSSSRCFRGWAHLESIAFQTRAVSFVSHVGLCDRFSDVSDVFDFLIFSHIFSYALCMKWKAFALGSWDLSCPGVAVLCHASGRMHSVFRTLTATCRDFAGTS